MSHWGYKDIVLRLRHNSSLKTFQAIVKISEDGNQMNDTCSFFMVSLMS